MISTTRKTGLTLTIMIVALYNLQVSGADDVQKLESKEQYIVQVNESEVFHGKKRVGFAVLGALVDVTYHRGPWRYSPQLSGWIHQKNLVLLEKAVTQFTADIQKDPTPALYHLRGISYMAQQDWGRALNDLEESYSLGESSVTLHLNLGTCLANLGLNEKAQAEFSHVIENYPQDAAAYIARGDLYLDAGELDLALKDLRKGAELSPDSAEIFNSIGVSLRLQGDYQGAIDAYNSCIELDANFAPAYVNRGFAYKNLKQFKKALADYEKALEFEPDSPAAQNDLAWLLATCEDSSIRNGERAVKLALEACSAHEYRKPDYVDTLAAAYASLGNFEKAIETAQTAIALFEKEEYRSESTKRLELYKNDKPYIEEITHSEEGSDQNDAAKNDSAK